MLDRLAEIETKYEDLAEQMNDPDIIVNQTEWRKRMKEYSDMTPIVEKYREYKQARDGIEESLAMLNERIPMTKRMSSWRFAVARAAMKRHCSQEIYFGCMRAMRSEENGR